ncbi:MAG: serine/threonine protein kinase [Myxococcales bacterium]|nr:serine/threonine protein kinase [Myxococcales bacterium]MCB9524811.1 serine/threonine protein kinase [Myxococcales bacterium]
MNKHCPVCGYEGDRSHCPNDGERLLTAEELKARQPPEPTQAPPTDRTIRAHAPAMGGDATLATGDHEALRDENFGKWAEPQVRKKADDPMIGRNLGDRYEVQALIGKGGMGAVYKARQPAVQRDIALKVLLDEFVENETVVRRFHQEALAASRLTHPNTIKIYDFGQTDDHVLYIAMEYLRGHSLAQELARKPRMAPKRAVHIMRQVCKSLAEAHRAGIIHRDLKPDNIFLADVQGERDFVKVLDFGVAKLKEFDGKEGTLTQAGMIFGTPKYMSPEQARSTNLDRRSDIYALGIILYEMLAGEAPFQGDNPLSILIAHVNQHARPFRQLDNPPEVPPALEAVVFKALAKHPDGRQASADVLLAELDAVDAILDGAPYEAYADRLPPTLVGGDGTPSIVGPAIIPQGSDSTAHGAVGGNTEVLAEAAMSASDPTAFEVGSMPLAMDPSDLQAPRSKAPLLAILLVALVAVGAGVAFMMSGGEPAVPDAGVGQTLASTTPSVGGRAPTTAAPASAAADAALKDAGPQDAAPPDAAVGKEFVIASDPSGARIMDDRTGRKVGVTYARIQVAEETTFTLVKNGYKPRRFTINPADEGAQRSLSFELEPKARRVEPPKPRTIEVTPVARPASAPATRPARIVAPVTAAPATADPIELQ